MRMSQLFSQTLRDAPADADIASHQLLLRAGYIRQLGAGIFNILPLGQRALSKIEAIIREEINAIGGQEVTLPVVHPAALWQETGRWYEIGDELTRFLDRGKRDMVLAMTHEEVITDMARREINSYRQLPMLLYQIQTKWRDEPRPRAGLIRVREFSMKDSYSLDLDDDGLDKQYRAHYQAYFNIYGRCGLPVIAVASDTGMMGGKLAHEYMYLASIGEDTLLVSEETGYAANREIARFLKPAAAPEDALPLEKIPTPNTTTIDSLAQFLNIPTAKTAKAVFMMGTFMEDQQRTEKFIFVVIRGDMDVNERKLANVTKAVDLRPATEAEIRAIGAVPGYGSPIGVKDCLIVVDDAVPASPNLVAGGNEDGYHYINVNYGRDYTAQFVADIATARDGDTTFDGNGILKTVRGVEVGNIFKLGTRYSAMMGATYLDKEGQSKPIVMGSYGIGVGRLLACIAEHYHDDKGLILPVSVAPYQVHLVVLPGDAAVAEQAETVYRALQASGIEVLYDDRDERAGVKFNDADLIGAPLRLTISAKSLEKGGAEFKRRAEKDNRILPMSEVVPTVVDEVAALHAALAATVKEVEYRV
jgi:prolyl-tRNA synthetase